ncbi:AAA family ATPase [Streptomyces sp. NPDC094032]|uniref:AAA family ATPase n=1 Tax=Streptomyces sp. NPDC094032 TaxID=3155308 RepID=UPI00332A46C0
MTTSYEEAEEILRDHGMTPDMEDLLSWGPASGSRPGDNHKDSGVSGGESEANVADGEDDPQYERERAEGRRRRVEEEKEQERLRAERGQAVLFVAESPCPVLEEIEEPEWLVIDPVSGLGIAPANHVIVMSGRGGCAKTTVAIGLLARVTRGTSNGALAGRKHHVLYVAVEDSWKYTLTARFAAAEADLGLVHKFTVRNGLTGDELRVSFPRFIDQLRERIIAEQAKVVGIDPLLGVLDDKLNSAKAEDIRKALDPLARLADETDCTIIVITHVRKSGGDAGDAISGTHAIRDAVRCHWAFTKERGSSSGLILVEKNNLGSEDFPPFEYEIEERKIPAGDKLVTTTVASLTGAYSDRRFEDVASKKSKAENDRYKCDEAAAEIVRILEEAGGRADSRAVVKMLSGKGVSRATAYRVMADVVLSEPDPHDKRRSVWVLKDALEIVSDVPHQSQNPAARAETETETDLPERAYNTDQSQSQSHAARQKPETERTTAAPRWGRRERKTMPPAAAPAKHSADLAKPADWWPGETPPAWFVKANDLYVDGKTVREIGAVVRAHFTGINRWIDPAIKPPRGKQKGGV